MPVTAAPAAPISPIASDVSAASEDSRLLRIRCHDYFGLDRTGLEHWQQDRVRVLGQPEVSTSGP
jgi:hypothetical protein